MRTSTHTRIATVRSAEDIADNLEALQPIFEYRSSDLREKMADFILDHAGEEKVVYGVMNIIKDSLDILSTEAPLTVPELRVLIPSLAYSLVDDTSVAAEGARLLLQDTYKIIPTAQP